MFRSALLLLCAILLNSFSGTAQQYNFKQISVEDGLPRSGVYCLLEDSRGYLWIGSEGGGLARFDGREFITYTIENGLADNTIRCLFEDETGNIWAGTNGHGLSKFDGFSFETFSTENGLSNDYVRCITEDADNNIWIGTFGGGINQLSFGDSLKVEVFDSNGPLESDNVRACLTDSEGQLWFGTDAGLCSYNQGNWNCLTKENGLPHERALVLYEDQLKNLWVGTRDGAAKMTENGFEVLDETQGMISNRIRAICQDNSGNMWFGTQEGVSRYDGEKFLSFTEKNGLSNDRIRHIISDRMGNLWFGTYFGGICRFSGEEFIHFTEQDGLSSNQILSVFNHPDSSIWLGSLEGLNRVKPSSNGTWNVSSNPLGIDLSDHSVNTIVKHPDGDYWLGTDKGILIRGDDKTSWFELDGFSFDENVKALMFDKDGSVWVGSTQGATRFEKTETGYVFNQYHSNANINESEVSAFLRDTKNQVWVGYLNAEFVVFDGEWFNNPSLPEKLTNISFMVKDSVGNIWLATHGNGLFRYTAKADSIKPSDFEHFGQEVGFSSTDLHQLIFDTDNNLWVGTATGVDKVELNGQVIESVRHFGRDEGFSGIETNENAVALDTDGNLWFGTIGGVTRFSPKAGKPMPITPRIHITDVHLSFENDNWGMSDFSQGTQGYFRLPNELKLPYIANDLTISFNAIDLRSPEKVRYQWKLDGYSDDWSVIEASQTIPLANIPPGKHTFTVRAIGGFGVWTSEPATFSFSVRPPFYFTWWFITLASILVIGLIYFIIKQRERIYKKREEELQQKVDERTIELRAEKERSDELLLNILPLETAEELKKKGYASVQQYDRVSVLFTDFVGFTNITEGITHQELVKSLDEHFRMFDEVMDKYGIEKIKTIGDAYMAAGGIPTRTITNPLSVVAAGLEMVHRLAELNRTKELKGEKAWQLRLGIHTGSVISGVVGKNKFAFDIWGDAVNTAARMESSGEVMKVNVSGSTYELIKEYFECSPRGKIKAKNKGEIEMYFVDRLKPEFSDDGHVANATFMAIVSKDGEKISMAN